MISMVVHRTNCLRELDLALSESCQANGIMGKDMLRGMVKAIVMKKVDLSPRYLLPDSSRFIDFMVEAQVIAQKLKDKFGTKVIEREMR